jgi:hypothetical protein
MPTIPPEQLVPGVTQDEDFLVFHVRSSRPNIPPHRVDLQRYHGAGVCTCEDFVMRKAKKLAERAMPHPSLECVHIRQAKRYLLFKILNGVIEERENRANENKAKASSHMGKSLPVPTPPSGRAVRETPPATAGPVQDWPEDESGYVPF